MKIILEIFLQSNFVQLLTPSPPFGLSMSDMYVIEK